MLGGKPLLQWTVDAARGSRFIDRLVLTTDDDEIAAVGRTIGLDVPFMRPAAAATDEATADDVIDHVLSTLDGEFDYLVFLQPTSPFRTTTDIDGCLELLAASDADSCVSVVPTHVKPEWLFHVEGGALLVPVSGQPPPQRRQELRPAYELNGAVYAARLSAYRRTRSFHTGRTLAWIMPVERSVDLDEESDFERAEALLRGM